MAGLAIPNVIANVQINVKRRLGNFGQMIKKGKEKWKFDPSIEIAGNIFIITV